MNGLQDRALKSVTVMRAGLLSAIADDQFKPARHQPRVYEAIDLLRASRADQSLVQRVEEISCTLHVMNGFLHQGRVNAYASARLRLRSAAAAL
jgi:hypothetical protein